MFARLVTMWYGRAFYRITPSPAVPLTKYGLERRFADGGPSQISHVYGAGTVLRIERIWRDLPSRERGGTVHDRFSDTT